LQLPSITHIFAKTKESTMKKTTYVMLGTTLSVVTMMILLSPGRVTGSGKSSPAGPGASLPDSVSMVFKRACMDCHSDDGSGMARGKVNFSQWEKYDTDKQVKKAENICEEITKGGMPPKKWRANNPNDVPTAAEVNLICKWAGSLKK
jgi:hypothetical protein